MKLTIDRSRWLRGEGSKCSALLRESDEKMCCLGFYSLAKGAARDEILGTQEPQEIERCHTIMPELLGSIHAPTELTRRIMNVNDSQAMHDSYREEVLTAHFKLIGVDVEFVDQITTKPT